MDLDFSPSAAATWYRLSDLEQIRVELALRRVAMNHVRIPSSGTFDVATYDLRIRGRVEDQGGSLFIEELARVTEPGLASG